MKKAFLCKIKEMEAFRNFLQSMALLLFVGAVPSLCWACGLFDPLSFPSFFLILSGIVCFLWVRSWSSLQVLKKVLLVQGEEWAIVEGNQFSSRSQYFPGESLEAFKDHLTPEFLAKAQPLLARLIHENLPFHLRIETKNPPYIYKLKGAFIEGKTILLLRNITNTEHKEHLHTEKLHKAEEFLLRMQSTFDVAPLLIWHRDNQQKITYCNQAYANAVQASLEKVCAEGIELISARAAKTIARKAFNIHETQMLESAAIANGERRHFRIYEMPDPRREGTLGIAYDITELATINAEIKRLIEAHCTVLDHLSTAVAVYDGNAILQYYNQAYVVLYDFDEEFLKTKPRLEEVLEDLRHRRQLPEFPDFPAYKKHQILQLQEQVTPQEELVHLPDERTLRIFRSPHPLGGLLFMFEDVTDYLALERTNKALFDAYQTTLDNLFEGVVVLGSDSRIKIFNPSFIHLWGFKEGEIEHGQHLTHVIEKTRGFFEYTDEDWELFKKTILANLTERVPKAGQLSRKDGTVVNFGYVPLPNGDHLFSYTDATNTSLVQQALQEKNEALETADRLKSEFIANVSHELRSPLTTIIGFTEVLARQYFGELNERQIDYVNGVWDSSRKLLHLVNDILDLASIEAGYLTLQPSTVDIPSLLKEVANFVNKRAENSGQYLTHTVEKDVHHWTVDERRLKQALFNLLSNSIKFTPPEGKIKLSARIKEDILEISVADTGIGISVDEQTSVFDKFKRGSRNPGVGLGLSLVKNIIELHGGYIHLHSEVDKGTCVTCVLPKIVCEEPSGKESEESLKQVQG